MKTLSDEGKLSEFVASRLNLKIAKGSSWDRRGMITEGNRECQEWKRRIERVNIGEDTRLFSTEVLKIVCYWKTKQYIALFEVVLSVFR